MVSDGAGFGQGRGKSVQVRRTHCEVCGGATSVVLCALRPFGVVEALGWAGGVGNHAARAPRGTRNALARMVGLYQVGDCGRFGLPSRLQFAQGRWTPTRNYAGHFGAR